MNKGRDGELVCPSCILMYGAIAQIIHILQALGKPCKMLGFKKNLYYSYIEHKSGLLLAAEKENQNT